MIKTEEYKQAEHVANNPQGYHENDLFKALTYTIAYREGYNQALSLSDVVQQRELLQKFYDYLLSYDLDDKVLEDWMISDFEKKFLQ